MNVDPPQNHGACWLRPPRLLLCAAMLLALPAGAQGAARAATGNSWMARMDHVVDGDSIWVRRGERGARVRLRLDGIDAPEICQSQGAQARAALQALVRGERLRVTVHAHDRFGRAIAAVQRERDGLDVAAQLVTDGWAWTDSRGWRRGRYWREEAAARAARRGVFMVSVPQRPADFRRAHGPCERRASSRKGQ